ncbi:MAG: sulfatase-like hydrolase/transferase [Acidobacteria bacterium]|nr:sulfatase-like hydrolase/transferase [Acidobacteriota bacterium]
MLTAHPALVVLMPTLAALLFAVLALVTATGCSRSEQPQVPRPNIIVVSIDTLRSDHLPIYGYDGVETPAIDRFAREATVFERAYSHSPMTLPSHASLFTGVLPPEHGLFVHYYEPHFPWEAEERFRQGAASDYDGEIAAADSAFGELIDQLRARGMYDDSLVVLLSDHGEGLGDHGEQFHGVFVYREAIQVPLLVRWPGKPPARISAPAQLIDVAPTLIAAAGTKPDFAGVNLELIEGAGAREIYAESLLPQIHFGWSPLRSMIRGEWHAIEAPSPELYDIVDDPAERVNVINDNRRLFASLRDSIAALGPGRDTASEVSDEEQAKLAALGYLGGTAGTASSGIDPKERIGEIEALFEASTLAARGDRRGAIEAFEALVARSPGLTDAWTRLGALHEEEGDLDRAIEAFRQTARLAPSMAREHALTLANLYLKKGDLEAAREHAELALPAHPGSARILLSTIASRRGESAEAEKQARAASADPAFAVRAELARAEALIASGELEPALAVLDALAGRVTDPIEGLQAARGEALARAGRAPEAERAFQRELQDFPRNRMAYSRLAILYAAAGRPDRSRGILDILVQIDRSPAARRLAVETLRAVGDEEGARRLEKSD